MSEIMTTRPTGGLCFEHYLPVRICFKKGKYVSSNLPIQVIIVIVAQKVITAMSARFPWFAGTSKQRILEMDAPINE